MADTGFLNPTATGIIDNDFTTPTNAYSSNDEWASSQVEGKKQDYYNFSFDIPEGSTINGIESREEGHGSVAYTSIGVQCWNESSSTWSSDPNDEWFFGTTDSVHESGSSSSLWGKTWQSSDFSNDNFKFRIESFPGIGTVYVDHIQVKIYYSINHTKILTETLSVSESFKKEVSLSKSENVSFLDQLISYIPTIIRHILHIGP